MRDLDYLAAALRETSKKKRKLVERDVISRHRGRHPSAAPSRHSHHYPCGRPGSIAVAIGVSDRVAHPLMSISSPLASRNDDDAHQSGCLEAIIRSARQQQQHIPTAAGRRTRLNVTALPSEQRDARRGAT
jgi:hypothetical protein